MYNNAKPLLTVEENEVELSERSTEVDIRTQAKEMREIISALKQTMEKENLIMLAAPEIGYKSRIFCINFETEIKTFINPMMSEADGMELVEEASAVLPGKRYLRPRCSKVTMYYLRPTGQTECKQFVGRAAILVQQMIDALDGIVESDIGLEIDEDFDNATLEEKSEIVKMYLDSLDLKSKDLNKEIEEDPELKEMNDGIKFMTSVIKGETKLE